MKDKLTTFVERLKMIGIEIELAGNYPWIYLNKIYFLYLLLYLVSKILYR